LVRHWRIVLVDRLEEVGMATTKERIEELTRAGQAPDDVRDLEAAWSAPAALPRPEHTLRRRLLAPIPPLWAVAGLIAWIVLPQIAFEVMPPPSPQALAEPVPLFASILQWGALGLQVAALAGFAARRRWGLLASLAAGSVLLGLTVACPISGHHEAVAAWWGVQLACFGALTAMSVAGLRKA
jgi:hypothetical protein